jgi:hypothetical protein
MGYRSDVDYLFYTGTRLAKGADGRHTHESIGSFAVLKLWFDENFPKHDYATITVGDDYIRVQYHGVKWYEGYEDVEAVKKATVSFDECFNTDDYDCMTGKWEMVRLGEEDNDIEHDGSPHHDWRLNIHREVTLT